MPNLPQERKEWSFRIANAFPADDPVARFVVVVSLGLNNTLLVNELFVSADADSRNDLIYLFNTASGHLWELAGVLRRASEEWKEVRDFVADLDEEYRQDFVRITDLAAPTDLSGIGARLKNLRNRVFHYPRLDRKTAERKRLPLVRALRSAADMESNVVVDPNRGRLSGIRAVFADEIFVKFLTNDYGEGEFEDLVERMTELQGTYYRFAQAALGAYLHKLPKGVVTEATTDS